MTLRLIPSAGHLAVIEMQETMLGLELANLAYPCSAWSLRATTSVDHVAVGLLAQTLWADGYYCLNEECRLNQKARN